MAGFDWMDGWVCFSDWVFGMKLNGIGIGRIGMLQLADPGFQHVFAWPASDLEYGQ